MNKEGLNWAAFSIIIVALVFISLIIIIFFSDSLQLSPEETHVECLNNTCTLVEGPGFNECSFPGSFCGCQDTDVKETNPDGMNPEQLGTTRNIKESKTDTCSVFGESIFEYICESGEVVKKEIDCTSFGFVCQNGRCLSEEDAKKECVDSDDGSDYFAVGEASQGVEKVQDFCKDEETLAEIICDNIDKKMVVELVDCTSFGDYKCQGGRCAFVN